jgi:putative aldouronate transport system substrate-binding protein
VKALNEAAKPSVLLGFTFDTSKVQDQIAACTEIHNRYTGEVLTGVADPAVAVPAMMTEMRAAGFDEIVTEAQAQVDAFLAAK